MSATKVLGFLSDDGTSLVWFSRNWMWPANISPTELLKQDQKRDQQPISGYQVFEVHSLLYHQQRYYSQLIGVYSLGRLFKVEREWKTAFVLISFSFLIHFACHTFHIVVKNRIFIACRSLLRKKIKYGLAVFVSLTVEVRRD